MKAEWKFEEHQRADVCNGVMCPKCLGKNIEHLGCVPTPWEANSQWRCKDCGEEWEGY